MADRLGASLVLPIRGLAEAAPPHEWWRPRGEGRAGGACRSERGRRGIQSAGERLDQLLIDEREAVADLSHRLRTPLTSLRLQVEKIEDPGDRAEVLTQADPLGQSIDQLIVATRAGSPGCGGTFPRCRVVKERTVLWRVLAEEQGRRRSWWDLTRNEVELGMAEESLEAVVDT